MPRVRSRVVIGLVAVLAVVGLAVAAQVMIGSRPAGPIDGLPAWWLEPDAAAGIGDAAARGSTTAIVWLTSDSGWLRLNSSMPRSLANEGHTVVVWNSLRYYLTKKEPERAAADLSAIVAALAERGHARIYLVGYSYGAGVLPFLVNRLPAEDRARVIGVALLAYPGSGEFRFSPLGWFGRVTKDALPAQPEVERLGIPVLCAAGESDPTRDCRSLMAAGATISILPTGHRLEPVATEVRRLLHGAIDANGASDANGDD